MHVRDLKQQLINSSIVGYELDEFSCLASADVNDGIIKDIFLDDNSLLPNEVGDITTMRITSRSIMIQFVNPGGQKFCSTFSKTMTIGQLKEKILFTNGLFDPGTKFRMGIIFFRDTGSGYRKLQGEAPIGDTLSDNDVIYCTEDIFFSQGEMIPVYSNDGQGETGRGWCEIGRVGCGYNDSVMSLKLRVQHQLGIPVLCLDVGELNFPNSKNVQIHGRVSRINVS